MIKRLVILTLSLLNLVNFSSAQQVFEALHCGFGTVTFNHTDFFDTNDLTGNGTNWGSLASCGLDNYTGGTGEAKCVNPGVNVPAFETELVTNSFNLLGLTTAVLQFRLNYQDLNPGVSDRLEVQIKQGNNNWQNLAAYIADVGTFQGTGVLISLNLFNFIDQKDLKIRWRYYDNSNGNDSGSYVQIDDIALVCTGGSDVTCSVNSSADTLIEGQEVELTFSGSNIGPATTGLTFFGGKIAAGFSVSDSTLPPPVIANPSVYSGLNENQFNFTYPQVIPAGGDHTTSFKAKVAIRPEAIFTVLSPGIVAGTYDIGPATFGPEFPRTVPLKGTLVLGEDGVGTTNDGCEPLTNAAEVSGNMVLLYNTSTCEEDEQIKTAQAAGAIAAIIADQIDRLVVDEVPAIEPSGMVTTPITIPSLRIDRDDADILKNQIVNTVMIEVQSIEVLAQKQVSYCAHYGEVYDPDFNFFALIFGGALGTTNNVMVNTITVLKDTDLDGVADTDDACRFDPAKTAPGVCNCGNPDVDNDNDGVVDCLLTDELKVDIQELLAAVKALKRIKANHGKAKRAAALALRDAAKALLDLVVANINANVNEISVSDTSVDIATVSKNTSKRVRRSLKLKRRNFKKLKRRAVKAVGELLNILK